MERLDEVAERVFARHETFHPRYGWFRKAVTAASTATEERDTFLAEDATVELGVGKNMVRSIRFWGRAAKLLSETSNPQRPRLPVTVPSATGLALFGDGGADPYLEFPGTLWVLHWLMLRPITELPVWWLTFQRFNAVEFSEDDLVGFAIDEVDRVGWDLPNPSSIRKDVACLLRMYSATGEGRASLDDLLDCPMRELGLIEPAWGEKRRCRFVLGRKASLPDLVVAYACLDWIALHDKGVATVAVNRLATAVGGPGRAFRLTEADISDALTAASTQLPGLTVRSSAGAPVLAYEAPAESLAGEALSAYYRVSGVEVRGSLLLDPTLRCRQRALSVEDRAELRRIKDPLKRLAATQNALAGQGPSL